MGDAFLLAEGETIFDKFPSVLVLLTYTTNVIFL
jgi:hypothetical protein